MVHCKFQTWFSKTFANEVNTFKDKPQVTHMIHTDKTMGIYFNVG